jgi:hypothetical protein
MARCWARLFFFLAFLASAYLSVDRTGEACCFGVLSGVASGRELSAAVMSIFISSEGARKMVV